MGTSAGYGLIPLESFSLGTQCRHHKHRSSNQFELTSGNQASKLKADQEMGDAEQKPGSLIAQKFP